MLGFAPYRSFQTPALAMDIIGVDEVLIESDDPAAHLRAQPLKALEPTREPYFALLCQPHGTIHGSTARVGNSDSQAVLPMYRSFLERAVDTQAQLVVTPEYSVPWTVLDDVIAGAVRPPKGALWALGFESITPDALDAIRERLEPNGDVKLIHEPFHPTKRAQTSFVDPLVYLFWGWNASNADVLCILIQFKTAPSRDADHIELTALYTGARVYKFNANNDHISLIGLICSEAFDFTDALVDEHHRDLLLLHIQLNQRPGHPDYAAYRQHLFSIGSRTNVEVICLNWAAGVVSEGGDGTSWNTVSNSAWYIAPNNVEVNDDVVNALHADGIYYSLVGRRWHGFYLNFSPHSLLLRKHHVFANGPQALVQQLAPQAVERLTWTHNSEAGWCKAHADDGFGTFIQAYAPLDSMLPGNRGGPLAVERALELLYGPHGDPMNWFALRELQAFKVGEEESLRRVTVSQETDVHREGVTFRRERARRAQAAATLQNAAPHWPPAVADLEAGFRFRWSSDVPHCNVEPISGAGGPATLVYLGENPEDDVISNMRAGLTKALRRHAVTRAADAGEDMNAAATRSVDRLCIAYKRNHELVFVRDPSQASITATYDSVADDITGESL